ncbi:MAG: hypothetical protein ACQEW8_12200 [Actinomycetota bacterium]
MIDSGVPDDAPVSAASRERWRSQTDDARVYGSCDCGTCPSIELGGSQRPAPEDGPRIVLSGSCPGGMLMLFIDDDHLSYLELAPIEDDISFAVFPDPTTLTFD